MRLTLWQIDAFATEALEGNPAAVIPLEKFGETSWMQKIANENNLAETSFIVRQSSGCYALRWFTPVSEIDLCGHATLASAWLVFQELEPTLSEVFFDTRAGVLAVKRGGEGKLRMSLPSDVIKRIKDSRELALAIGDALGSPPPDEIWQSRYLIAVWKEASEIRALRGCGNIGAILRSLDHWGLVVTAPGDQSYDFVSRFFAPDKGIPEDSVTGSAYCALAAYWAGRLGKTVLSASQVGPRGGDLICIEEGVRVTLVGSCALYMRGEIAL